MSALCTALIGVGLAKPWVSGPSLTPAGATATGVLTGDRLNLGIASSTRVPSQSLSDQVKAALASGAPEEPASLVDTFVGTANQGDTFPGATMPFGMIQWSPDTTSLPPGGGFSYNDTATTGLSLTHLSGPACPVDGDVPILPTVGGVGPNPQGATQSLSHSTESASPGYYSAELGAPAIGMQLAVTDRTGIAKVSFPASMESNLLFKVGDSQAGDSAASVNIVSPTEITGSSTTKGFCGQHGGSTLYFVAVVSSASVSSGTWQSGEVHPNGVSANGPGSGAWLSFNTYLDPVIYLKVAISYTGISGAEENLQAEDPAWSLSSVRAQATAAWNGVLDRIQVAGGTPAEESLFYTNLYHSLLDPTLFSDASGAYLGFDEQVHHLQAGQAQYTDFSEWDIYRSEMPLLAVLVPRRAGQMVQSLLRDADQGGWLPKWPVANHYTGVMTGDSADPVIAGALAFGAQGVNVQAVLQAMLKGALSPQSYSSGDLGQGWYMERPGLSSFNRLGYVPGEASETLEYALDDFAVAQVAASSGHLKTSQLLLSLSGNWRNTFDTQDGYIQPRSTGGAFPSQPPAQIPSGDIAQPGFDEGNAAQYTWLVPQDVEGLISALGGDSTANARLDAFFEHLNAGSQLPYYWAGNEPDLEAPFLYDYTGAPWKTQAITRAILTKEYSLTPGGIPGNDDLGELSSWAVWAALGMYPETPGLPIVALSSPSFPDIAIHSGSGHTLLILAPAAPKDTYVGSASLDSAPWTNDWLPASALGGEGYGAFNATSTTVLDLGLSRAPQLSWASSPASAPPSISAPEMSVPEIASVASADTQAGVEVTVRGSNFFPIQGNGYVHLTDGSTSWGAPYNEAKLSIISWSNHSIVFRLPSLAIGSTGLQFSIMAGSSAEISIHTVAGASSAPAGLAVP